ncbi:UDP-N-acetylmuramoyl-L-alanyl-D-glutamate--2,6-diaminopimelate ligase [Pseudodesulfovibrio sp.]|uniref:UDP-N-acetylmuramoyl-L-alanyl-D-glutamate--2, 6-diaminopimelate ligase n=1 Tax=unclassified Pseudodesulfovibrio TaxID=2661612 RepID=UPI003B004290
MFLFSGSPSEEKAGVMQFETLLKKVAKGLMVRTDSRQVQPGECFVAMPGTQVRGIDFIPSALDKGAKYIVAPESDREQLAPVIEKRAQVVYHENPAVALGELARQYFRVMDRDLKLVGITGTNGKTTTTYLLEHLLQSAGLKVGVIGTVNYRWPGFEIHASRTTPDCWMIHELLYNMKKADVDIAIMEVSSHALVQHRVAGLEFEAAVMTNLTQDHLDYHHDMETYFQAKRMLFTSYLKEGKAGIFNYNDSFGRRLLAECDGGIGYGIGQTGIVRQEVGDKPMVQGTILEANGKGMHLKVDFKGNSWEIESPLIGGFNAMNLLGAQAVALQLGLGSKDMRRMKDFHGVPGRLERVPNDKGLDIFVDFAHTPDALENVQRTLKQLDFKRLITVFGCGGDRDKTKRPIMAQSVAKYADVAVLTSDNPRSEVPEAIMDDARPGLEGAKEIMENPNRRAAIRMAINEMNPGDAVLIAGKGHEDYQVLKDETIHFSDVEEAAKAIEERQ